ncbi:nucleic acid-binding, partial [Striga asiatica]
MTNFEIQENKGDYKTTQHQYMLIFHECTAVKLSELRDIPRFMFNFVEFSELRGNSDYTKSLCDIIVEVIKIDEVVNGETMECTLWNQFAIQMVDFWKAKKDEPVVIILQYAM